MRRISLLAVLALGAACAAPAAQADSTTTQTLARGESMRSSPDAAPSPATPVIATVTNTSNAYGACQDCPPETYTFTLTLKDKHDRARGPGLEGPNGLEYVGPQVDITASGSGPEGGPPGATAARHAITFEVDPSAFHPGFFAAPGNTGINSKQFFFFGNDPGKSNPGGDYSIFGSITQLAAGDVLLNPAGGSAYSNSLDAKQYDVAQQEFYARAGISVPKESLPTALRKGVKVDFFGNYRHTAKIDVAVSPSVAKRLRLKSRILGTKTFTNSGLDDGTVKFNSAARKALKKYKKVVVYAESTHTTPWGEKETNKAKVTLTTAKPGDDELE